MNEEVAVGEDLGFQRWWWRFERIVWARFVIIIALDLAARSAEDSWRVHGFRVLTTQ